MKYVVCYQSMTAVGPLRHHLCTRRGWWLGVSVTNRDAPRYARRFHSKSEAKRAKALAEERFGVVCTIEPVDD